MSSIFLTADLVFSSRVTGAARQAGVELAVVPTVAALVERCREAGAALVILDLSFPRLDTAGLLETLRALPNPPAAVVAYAPHVHENLLAAATAAGCTEVLTRGEFSAQMERVLSRYAAG